MDYYVSKRTTLFVLIFVFSSLNFTYGEDRLYESPQAQYQSKWSQLISELLALVRDKPKSYALVVGISDFSGGYSNLPTKKDAEKMFEFLRDEAKFDHIRLLTEKDATKSRIEYLMNNDYPDEVESEDRFLLYWSGHGDQNTVNGITRGYLPLSTSRQNEFSKMIAMDEFDTWDLNIKSHQSLFLLDACFSGLVGSQRKGVNPELNIKQFYRPSHHLMTAGTAEEQAIAGNDWNGSLFTTAVLDGWRGAADTTKGSFEADGIVSLSELIAYVKERVIYEADNKRYVHSMTPQLRDLNVNEGEFFMLTEKFDFSRRVDYAVFNPDIYSPVINGSVYVKGNSEFGDYLLAQVNQMNHKDKKPRMSATHRMKNEYASNRLAVSLVLDMLGPNNFANISNQAKVNYLFFLNNTNPQEWNPELKRKAQETINFLNGKYLATQANEAFREFSKMILTL